MPGQIPVMMNLQDGSVYQIGSLFKDGVDYLARLSNGVRAQDKQHVLDTFNPFKGVTNNDGFFVSDEGVTVFFSSYEWTPYEFGLPQFTVPYNDIQDIIDNIGLLWKAFNDSQAKADENIVAAVGNGQSLYVFSASLQNALNGSVQRLFFFLDDKYLGTDTSKDYAPIVHLAQTGEGKVSASYLSDNSDFTITFKWDGQKLQLSQPSQESYKG